MVDNEETCIVVMVYNTADSWGVLIGDSVVIPEPQVKRHSITHKDKVSVALMNAVYNQRNNVWLSMWPSPVLSTSHLILEVYEWTLLCCSSSTARSKTLKVRSLPPSATSLRASEADWKPKDQAFSFSLFAGFWSICSSFMQICK